MRIEEFLDNRERSPFTEWLKKLEKHVAARVTVALDRIEAGNMGDVKGVGGEVLEYRIHSSPSIRIYFAYDDSKETKTIILLGGGTKRRQSEDIKVAKRRWQEYISRQAEQTEGEHDDGTAD